MSIFACLIVLAFWFGFWLWFLSDDPSPDGRKAVSSPPALDSRGHFIRKVEPDENQDLADWAQ